MRSSRTRIVIAESELYYFLLCRKLLFFATEIEMFLICEAERLRVSFGPDQFEEKG